jgi:Fe-S-cluster containining protein
MSNFHNEKLDKIYRSLPTINCQKKCDASCGIIPVGDLEVKRITEWLGYNPFPSPEEMLADLQFKKPCELGCSLLKEGQCKIYRIRPLICRLFGLIKKMQCPFGCVPSEWLDDKTAKKLLNKAKYDKIFNRD